MYIFLYMIQKYHMYSYHKYTTLVLFYNLKNICIYNQLIMNEKGGASMDTPPLIMVLIQKL